MALTYDIRSIPDDVKIRNDHMNPITECIIFATIPTDIGEITEDNYREFYLRYKLFNTAIQPLEPGFDSVSAFNLEDVRNHIGLKTNVFTIGRHAWVTTRLSKQYMNESINRHKRMN